VSQTFEAHLRQSAQALESDLEKLLTSLGAKSAGSGSPQNVPERLVNAMRHAVLGGGKRFRPFLVFETSGLFGVARPASLRAAIAVELIHCYSLVHDDLPSMDNDLIRRGQPTVWSAFDEWTAILAGDALQALAFELLSGKGSPAIEAAVGECGEAFDRAAPELTGLLAVASGAAGMVGGQVLDLMEDNGLAAGVPTPASIRALQAMKTGALIRFSCEAGAVLGDASAEERAALIAYGERLGYAFQIADDLLDVEGDVETVGKAVAKDTQANKATLVSLMGVNAAREALAETEAAAISALSLFGERADTLRKAAAFVVHRQS